MEYLITVSTGTEEIGFRRPTYEEAMNFVQIVWDSIDLDSLVVTIRKIEKAMRF